ncbi:MAG: acyltransferase [Prevotella sp.]|nr:acyltransferase [Prevotella sp.]
MKQRIEYIDAMRGFTMILVVYSHVCNFCLGDKWMGWNDVFFLFRLPCFFFISGWLFEPHRGTVPCVSSNADYTGTVPSVRSVVKKKFMVQIVPTIIFLLLLAPPPLFFSKLGATKGGYWFTFALFVFFLLYLLSERYLKRWGGVFALMISIAAFCYDAYYNRYFKDMGMMTQALGFLSFITWRYYLFFFIGTRVKRHFEVFLRWTSQPIVMAVVVIGFVWIAMNPRSENAFWEYIIFAVGGILGMTMIFTLFRYLYTIPRLSPLTSSLSPLKYIGTRTLDIYLLHYFFLPRFLSDYAPQLQAIDSRLLEFTVAISLSLVVVAVCLLVSYIIRLNPFLGHYLFGVRQ